MAGDYVLTTLDALAKRYQERCYVTDPAQWIQDKLGEWVWSKQREIMESVMRNRYTAVQSCHGAGKSFIAARIAAWWLSTKPVGQALVVSTAPTAAQVSDILWKEISTAHQKGGLFGYITRGSNPQWKDANGDVMGVGRKPSDHNDHAFQGRHARYVLVIIDEACGVAPSIWHAVDALVTNNTSAVLAIGNPTDPSAHFEKICRPQSGWNTIRIDALESPNMCRSEVEKLDPDLQQEFERVLREAGINYSEEHVPEDLRDLIVSPQWVAERARRWGTGSALWASKVRGLFPDDNHEGVIPLGAVMRAVARWNRWNESGRPEQIGRDVVACDVARFGDDKSVIAERQGNLLRRLTTFSGLDLMQLAAQVKMRRIDGRTGTPMPHALTVVDVNGMGGGVVDRLRHDGIQTIAFNASRKSKRKDKLGEFTFLNTRSASWWHLRERLVDRDPDNGIMLPDDEDLIADLTTPKWQLTKTGAQIQVEEKAEIKKRLGRSTDKGDAVVMAFFYDASPVDGDGADPVPWDEALSNWDGPSDVETWVNSG